MTYLLSTFIFLAPLFSFGGQFSSAFLDFDLPPGWSCKHISGSWNCSNPNSSKTKGLIVVTTKKPKLGTTLQSYKSKLLQAKKNTWNGKTVLSDPQSVEEITLRGQKWIQATHLNGEIPDNITKYLITIKGGLAILVSFTAHNEDYPKLSPSFLKAIDSLRTRNTSQGRPQLATSDLANGSIGRGNPNAGQASSGLDDLFEEDHLKKKGGQLTLGALQKIGALLLIILGVVFYLASKRKKR